MKNNLFREISHTADLAYEIEAANVNEMLQDFITIIIQNSEIFEKSDTDIPESMSNIVNKSNNEGTSDLQNVMKKCYNINKSNDSEFVDNLFDAVNDIISLVDRGYFPVKVENQCVYFTRKRVILRIKALTYHGLEVKLGERISLKVVFDI
ncbi:archease [Fervidobacterium pennivorans subsp. carthaginiensis]|uniref:archease n=1 Tax=Fervidobacterium pennivorans TaxID=93466 RepID=UPI0014367CE5|nr:archease [Fervidobacterium pennivorans]QIV78489.1 archease [Fervidobacterium pennivorans subsp. keratinolyticus]